MTRRAGRWWRSAGLALLAGLAVASGLDRLSEHRPAAARQVPQVIRSHAARAVAAEALAEGDMAAAQAAARQAIIADPLDRRGPAYLAAAQAMAGQDGQAARGFAVADRLSRREPLTQSYLYGSAMVRGDHRAAARQVDILLRAYPDFPAAGQFLSHLEATPAGRAALVDRLARGPAWADAYFEGHGADDAVLRRRAEALAQATGEATPGCRRIAPLIRTLERRNMSGEAHRLRDARCSASPQEGKPAKFSEGWQRHPAGDARIEVGGEAGRRLILESRASVTRLMLSRAITLPPGAYRAVARVEEAGADRVAASLTCGTPERPARGDGTLDRGQVLHAAACDDLVLALWLRPGAGTVKVSDLRIEPVAPQPHSRP